MKWEYKVETYTASARYGGELVRTLNERGAEGWEIVTVESSGSTVVWFKRVVTGS